MKTLLFIIALFAGSITKLQAQRGSHSDSSKYKYNPEVYSSDSAKRGNQVFDGSRGHNKSNGDTLKGGKSLRTKPGNSTKQSSTSKNKRAQTGAKSNKRITLAFNEFKV